LRGRIARAAEAATGISRRHWMQVVPAVSCNGESWEPHIRGDPTDIAIARRIAEEVRRHFPVLYTVRQAEGGAPLAIEVLDILFAD
jgi:hypothetical protein